MYKLIGIDTEEEEGDTGYFGFRPVGFGQQLQSIKVVDANGNDVTPAKARMHKKVN